MTPAVPTEGRPPAGEPSPRQAPPPQRSATAPRPPSPSRAWHRPAATALSALLVYGVAFAAFAWAVLPAAGLVGVDAYYHIQQAHQMRSQGIFMGVPWLPFTILGDAGPDHHLLWHVLLMPFAQGPDLFTSAKWAIVATAALVPAGLALWLRALRVPWAPVFALLAATGAVIMPGRLAMLRAQNLAILFVAAAVWALLRRRHGAAFVVAAAFTAAYHGAAILAPVALLYALVVAATERRFAWRGPAALALGATLALVASPWFPANVEYLFFHALFVHHSGNEWLTPPLAHVLTESLPAHATLALSLLLAWRARGRRPAQRPAARQDRLVLLALATLFVVMYSRTWRFAEYYVPVAALTAGVFARGLGARGRRVVVAVAALGVLWGGTRGLALLRDHADYRPEKWARVGAYLRAHARPGELIYNREFSDFPLLMFHAPALRYANGLDPAYLAYSDPERFAIWRQLAVFTPATPDDPAPIIARTFQTRWAVVNRNGPGLAARLAQSPHAQLVVRSRWGWLFALDPAPARDSPAPHPTP